MWSDKLKEAGVNIHMVVTGGESPTAIVGHSWKFYLSFRGQLSVRPG